MSNAISVRLFCRVCHVEIFRKGPGRPPSRCADCVAEFKRQNTRDYLRRLKDGYVAPTTFRCVGCDGTFPRPFTVGQIPIRCEPCWKVNEADRIRQRDAEAMAKLRRIFETEGRWTSCEACDVDIRCRGQKSPAPRFCDKCRYERRRELDQKVRPWKWKGGCSQCGSPDGRFGRDGRRLPCWSCLTASRSPEAQQWLAHIAAERRADAAKYGPSAVRLRGPWDDQYTNLEIWQRDRWVCQICTKKVDQSLRWPNPLAPTADHIIPRSQGGLDLRVNVRLAHFGCNSSRNNRGGNEQLALLSA